ncbi:endolytic transglycosylase MltG [Pseudoflavonifractor phocaeensis]|uniref:endolytic transglycosylase MltG n=1 Tax=Pseudoflavonifractor phocaeensis TaxID=1870988 RepID=UPI0019563B35|nr:endolytic transglycosylase MltG [Pseudoflavonifractor phocaeensis]MBM6925758.1 endolytic transglycosylase MltG [Pseudoflavonifractor phocaeensis]
MSQEEYRNQDGMENPSRASHPGKRLAPSGKSEGSRTEKASRPRKKRKRLGAWGVLIYVVCVLGVSALLAGVSWMWANDVLALNKAEHSAVVEVAEGDTVDQVADKLKENGLIEYPFVFKLFCAFTHVSGAAGEEDAKITPGTYELNTDMDYRALVSSMGSSSSSRLTTTVTIPEGTTLAQIFQMLENAGVSTVEHLTETAANYDFKFSFLQGELPLGDATRLEGYLFPDTYEFYMGENPVSVLNKMILRFDEIFTDEMRQAMTDKGMTVNDAVIIASLIEKETDGTDQGKISSVIYNRLLNPTSETAGYLNIDASILYATGGTEVDLNADTPYNTSTHTGLPPTAICCPGVDALKAAVSPESTSYYFYALGDDGVHHFFNSYSQHQAFVASQELYQNG